MLQFHGDEGPVVLRRGPCCWNRLPRDQGRARAQRCRDPGAGAVSHRLSPAGSHTSKDVPGGTGETFAWELARVNRTRSSLRVPVILAGGLTAGQRRRGDRDRSSVRGRCRQRHPVGSLGSRTTTNFAAFVRRRRARPSRWCRRSPSPTPRPRPRPRPSPSPRRCRRNEARSSTGSVPTAASTCQRR